MNTYYGILQPLCAQVVLTFLVWMWMYYTRLTTMAKNKIHPQSLANDNPKAEAIMKTVINPSDNLENLFELPVLFYVAAIVIYVLHTEDSLYLNLAWAYVIFRTLHSIIHCTFNNVSMRFTAYLFSSIALWTMWARITITLFTAST